MNRVLSFGTLERHIVDGLLVLPELFVEMTAIVTRVQCRFFQVSDSLKGFFVTVVDIVEPFLIVLQRRL
jgi:hypothetical protein